MFFIFKKLDINNINNINNLSDSDIEELVYKTLLKDEPDPWYNEDDDSLKEYKSIQNKLDMYKEYKTLVNNSIELIKQIYEYNKKNEQKLFNNHNTFSSFDNIISNKLSMDTQKMTDRRTKLLKKNHFHLNTSILIT